MSIFILLTLFSFFIVNKLQDIFGFSDTVYIISSFIIISILGFSFSKALSKPLYDSKKSLDIYIKNTLHELNIPISTINANIKLLEKSITNPKDQKRVNRIKAASKNLQELYEELEYLLKKENDHIISDEFDIKELLQDVVAKFDDIKKEIVISLDIDSQIIKCDKRGFVKVVENLISNALKFNKKNGTILIVFKNSTLCIKDSGIGIETKNLFNIFERYYKENEKEFGHGIGLNIVKEFCDKNSIDIKIESKVDVGTKICLHLNSLTIS